MLLHRLEYPALKVEDLHLTIPFFLACAGVGMLMQRYPKYNLDMLYLGLLRTHAVSIHLQRIEYSAHHSM
jgi:hypothetical protein